WQEAVDILHAVGPNRVEITVRRKGMLVTTRTVLADHNPQSGKKVGFLGIGPTFVVKHYSPTNVGPIPRNPTFFPDWGLWSAKTVRVVTSMPFRRTVISTRLGRRSS